MMERIRRAQQEDGFTLIEVLVVISILGVLAGIVVFSVAGLSDRGQQSSCKTEKKTILTAIEAYKANPPVGGPAVPTMAELNGKFLADTPTWYTVTAGAPALTAAGTTAGCT